MRNSMHSPYFSALKCRRSRRNLASLSSLHSHQDSHSAGRARYCFRCQIEGFVNEEKTSKLVYKVRSGTSFPRRVGSFRIGEGTRLLGDIWPPNSCIGQLIVPRYSQNIAPTTDKDSQNTLTFLLFLWPLEP